MKALWQHCCITIHNHFCIDYGNYFIKQNHNLQHCLLNGRTIEGKLVVMPHSLTVAQQMRWIHNPCTFLSCQIFKGSYQQCSIVPIERSCYKQRVINSRKKSNVMCSMETSMSILFYHFTKSVHIYAYTESVATINKKTYWVALDDCSSEYLWLQMVDCVISIYQTQRY